VPPEIQAIDWNAYDPLQPNDAQKLYGQLEKLEGFDALTTEHMLSTRAGVLGNRTFPLITLSGSRLSLQDGSSPVPFRLFLGNGPPTGNFTFRIVATTSFGGNTTIQHVYYDNELDNTHWVPFPRLGSPHAHGAYSNWIVIDHPQWLISFKHGDQRIIYRYLYPGHR
jgi:hypothetical protein